MIVSVADKQLCTGSNFCFGRTLRLRGTAGYQPTGDVPGRDLQRQLDVDTGRLPPVDSGRLSIGAD